jgi:hypothetical protein
MIPFMKKKEASISVSVPMEHLTRDSDHEDEMDGHDEMMEAIAHELLDAVHKRNPKDLVMALRAAFQVLDSEPHVEGEHPEGEE